MIRFTNRPDIAIAFYMDVKLEKTKLYQLLLSFLYSFSLIIGFLYALIMASFTPYMFCSPISDFFRNIQLTFNLFSAIPMDNVADIYAHPTVQLSHFNVFKVGPHDDTYCMAHVTCNICRPIKPKII